ncbi:unnamed protein product [Toxocara canis]|uniref:HMG box domain-containing protein n=1 Tax=Toxocara canis TaxID=6265 RepID=A0A183UE63_TOXCA|nr:unnamed protein product [Toxocara canis]
MARPSKTKASTPKKAKASSPTKKHKRGKKDPNAPKRGKSAYMFWLAENRTRLTKPGMSVVDVTKAAGAEWNTVKDKSKWEKMAADDKKRYEKVILFSLTSHGEATSSTSAQATRQVAEPAHQVPRKQAKARNSHIRQISPVGSAVAVKLREREAGQEAYMASTGDCVVSWSARAIGKKTSSSKQDVGNYVHLGNWLNFAGDDGESNRQRRTPWSTFNMITTTLLYDDLPMERRANMKEFMLCSPNTSRVEANFWDVVYAESFVKTVDENVNEHLEKLSLRCAFSPATVESSSKYHY